MGYIRLKDATEILGVNSSTIPTSNRYKPFYIKTQKGKKESFFDLDGFLEREALEEELKQKSTLFVEYMRHVENITYTEMATRAKASTQIIANHEYSHSKALTMLRWYRDNQPHFICRFDKYYGWEDKRSLHDMCK